MEGGVCVMYFLLCESSTNSFRVSGGVCMVPRHMDTTVSGGFGTACYGQ